MTDIICLRGNGDRPGEDLVDPLTCTLEAALSRGRSALDEGALADETRLETVLLDLRLGQTIAIEDQVLGVWQGKLTSLAHTVSIDQGGNLRASSTFTLRKPRS